MNNWKNELHSEHKRFEFYVACLFLKDDWNIRLGPARLPSFDWNLKSEKDIDLAADSDLSSRRHIHQGVSMKRSSKSCTYIWAYWMLEKNTFDKKSKK